MIKLYKHFSNRTFISEPIEYDESRTAEELAKLVKKNYFQLQNNI